MRKQIVVAACIALVVPGLLACAGARQRDGRGNSRPTGGLSAASPGSADRLVVVEPKRLFAVEGTPIVLLSASEVAQVADAGAAIGARMGYYRNGCQSRAHALWASLAPPLREKVGKIWIFQPSQYAPILKQGAIGHPDDPGVKWVYHVALLYTTVEGTENVIDLAIGTKPVSVERWLATFSIPDHSLMIRTNGKYYSYGGNDGLLAYMYPYAGNSCKNAWMIGDVAFDRVGAQLMAKPSECPTLAAYIDNAVGGKEQLNRPDFATAHPGAGCSALKSLFDSESKRILMLVGGWARPGNCAEK